MYDSGDSIFTSSLNSVLLEGTVSIAPVALETPLGSKLCRFTITSSRYFKKERAIEEEVSMFNVEAWGRLSQSCLENIRVGRGLRIVGRIATRQGVMAVDSEGREYTPVYIVAEHVEFKPATRRV